MVERQASEPNDRGSHDEVARARRELEEARRHLAALQPAGTPDQTDVGAEDAADPVRRLRESLRAQPSEGGGTSAAEDASAWTDGDGADASEGTSSDYDLDALAARVLGDAASVRVGPDAGAEEPRPGWDTLGPEAAAVAAVESRDDALQEDGGANEAGPSKRELQRIAFRDEPEAGMAESMPDFSPTEIAGDGGEAATWGDDAREAARGDGEEDEPELRWPTRLDEGAPADSPSARVFGLNVVPPSEPEPEWPAEDAETVVDSEDVAPAEPVAFVAESPSMPVVRLRPDTAASGTDLGLPNVAAPVAAPVALPVVGAEAAVVAGQHGDGAPVTGVGAESAAVASVAPSGEPPTGEMAMHGTAHVGESFVGAAGVQLEKRVRVGDDVTLGAGTVLRAGAILGDEVAVGVEATLDDGVSVGDGTVLKARSVVCEDADVGARVVVASAAVVGDSAEVGDDVVIHVGAHIGELAQVGEGVVIGPRAEVSAGARLQAGATLAAEALADSSCTVGERSAIGSMASVGEGATVGSDVVLGHDASVGAGASIGEGCVLKAGADAGAASQVGVGVTLERKASLGDRVQVGAGCEIGRGSVIESGAVVEAKCVVGPRCVVGAEAQLAEGCVLEKRVSVGAKATLGAGVRVGAGAQIGAGAIVEAGALIARMAVVPEGARVSAE